MKRTRVTTKIKGFWPVSQQRTSLFSSLSIGRIKVRSTTHTTNNWSHPASSSWCPMWRIICRTSWKCTPILTFSLGKLKRILWFVFWSTRCSKTTNNSWHWMSPRFWERLFWVQRRAPCNHPRKHFTWSFSKCSANSKISLSGQTSRKLWSVSPVTFLKTIWSTYSQWKESITWLSLFKHVCQVCTRTKRCSKATI